MNRLALLLLVLPACATVGAPLPSMPPPTDVTRLVQTSPAPKPIETAGLPQYPDTPVDTGQCPGLPAGILLSEPSYAACIATTAERNRLRTELGAIYTLRSQEAAVARQIEAAYKRELGKAESTAVWRFWTGFAVGAGIGLLALWAGR